MLKLPESGFKPYKDGQHRTDLCIFCDWLEGSLLFTNDERISLSAIKDVLSEEYLYAEQDKASEFLAGVWLEFDRRKNALGQSYPVEIDAARIQRASTWRQSAPYAFCLLLLYADRYKKWSEGFGVDYTKQGALFEQITAEALKTELE